MSAGWDPNAPNAPQPNYAAEIMYQAMARTGPAGIMLVVVGVINLLLTLFSLGSTALQMSLTDEQYAEQMAPTVELLEKMFPNSNIAQEMTKPGMRTQMAVSNLISGGVSGVVSLLMIFGGVWMRQLRGYGVAMTGAILGLLPCLTATGCCGLGQVAGIWALVVLADANVRMGFSLASGQVPPQYPGQQYPGSQYPGQQYPPGYNDPNAPRYPGEGPR